MLAFFSKVFLLTQSHKAGLLSLTRECEILKRLLNKDIHWVWFELCFPTVNRLSVILQFLLFFLYVTTHLLSIFSSKLFLSDAFRDSTPLRLFSVKTEWKDLKKTYILFNSMIFMSMYLIIVSLVYNEYSRRYGYNHSSAENKKKIMTFTICVTHFFVLVRHIYNYSANN